MEKLKPLFFFTKKSLIIEVIVVHLIFEGLNFPVDCRAVSPTNLICLRSAKDHIRVSDYLISNLEMTLLDKLGRLLNIFNPLVHSQHDWESSSAERAYCDLTARFKAILLVNQT